MAPRKANGPILKALLSLVLLALFLWGVGPQPFFPSLRLLQDTQWDFSFFLPTWGTRLLSFLLILPAGLGLLGWSRIFQRLFFSAADKLIGRFLGLTLGLALFSLYVFALGENGLLYWPLTALFFVPALLDGWREWKGMSFSKIGKDPKRWIWWSAPAFLWAFEYLSPPLVWDAILDHFRYVREISRLHQIPFHWVNHTGDMPKAAELILAGFWNLGGESLSKLSLSLPALLTGWLLIHFAGEKTGKDKPAAWIFWTCPAFLALYAFGYAEGFLAFFEVTALFFVWKGVEEPKKAFWFPLAGFFLGFAFTVKYTAVLAIGTFAFMWLYAKAKDPRKGYLSLACFLAFLFPVIPWILKNWLAFGDPFYPFLTSFFHNPVGYSPEMEQGLLADTGVPWGNGLIQLLTTPWNSFFSTHNQLNAVWTPLVVMSLPWFGVVLKNKLGRFLLLFTVLYLGAWVFVSSSLRHASGGLLVLGLLAAMAWQEAFKEKKGWGRSLFGAGVLLSLWLCLSTQLTTTAPYVSALGLEDPLVRLKRHYSYSMETYQAYQYIESHSDPLDKVMAFAVFQTYPLERMAFVDFKWKRPIFFEWASHCRTAEQLAQKFREEGVTYFLYQRWEAEAMSKMEKDFGIVGMPEAEYKRFSAEYLERVSGTENAFVYRVRSAPL